MNKTTHDFFIFLARRFWIVWALSFLAGCSHQLRTTSVNRIDAEPIVLQSVDFLFILSDFSGDADMQKTLRQRGYPNGAYPKELALQVQHAFLTNGVATRFVASSSPIGFTPISDYYLVAKPSSLKVSTSMPSGHKFYSFNTDVAFYKRGVTLPIWKGDRFLGLDTDSSTAGNWSLGILNSLQSNALIVLPKGHAVTSEGNRNYVSDSFKR